MCSKRSSSLGAFLALLLVVGCREAPREPARVVSIRLAAVEAAHPLQEELRRLESLERLLAALESAGGRIPLIEPVSPEWQGGEDTTVYREADARRAAERETVERLTEASLADFSEEAERRLDRLVERRRAELLALERERQGGRAAEARARADAETRRLLEALAVQLQFADINEAALRAQLSQPADVVFPVTDAAAFSDQVRRLREIARVDQVDSRDQLRRARQLLKPEAAGESAFRPEVRARIQVMAEAAGTLRERLERQSDTAMRDGERRRREAVAQVLQLPLEAVEARIEELRQGDESSFSLQDAAVAIEETLTREARLDLAAARPGATARALLAGALPAADLSAARRAVARRRALCRQYLQEEARAAASDFGAAHGWEVRFGLASGVSDVTSEALRWIGWGGLGS